MPPLKTRKRAAWLVVGLGLGLLSMGALRLLSLRPGPLNPLYGLATPGYVLVTILFSIWLVRAGLPLERFGFGRRPGRRHVLLAVAAVALLRAFAVTVHPWIQGLLGERNLERFADVEGSGTSLVAILILSWTFAAFGEEIAYRIVLMRGISFALGDTLRAAFAALLIQATLFGLVHA